MRCDNPTLDASEEEKERAWSRICDVLGCKKGWF